MNFESLPIFYGIIVTQLFFMALLVWIIIMNITSRNQNITKELKTRAQKPNNLIMSRNQNITKELKTMRSTIENINQQNENLDHLKNELEILSKRIEYQLMKTTDTENNKIYTSTYMGMLFYSM